MAKPVKRRWPETERELAAPVVAWLAKQGFAVYQEVEAYGRTADIVAVDGKYVWAIECKRSLSLDLLEQADKWRWLAHWCSVAVPFFCHAKRSQLVERILDWRGIGLLGVHPVYEEQPEIVEVLDPKLNRKVPKDAWAKFLTEEHKTYCEAGSKSGRFTKFKSTRDAVVAYVRANPGTSAKQLFDNVKHHYMSTATARSRTLQLIERGVIAGLCVKRDGKRVEIWPMPQEEVL